MTLKALHKYGGLNSYDLLKLIAITTMVIDHIGFFFYPDANMLRVIGRAAYPLFAFCIGYNQKYRFDMTLLVLAIFMAITASLANRTGFSVLAMLQSSILPAIIITRLSMRLITGWVNEKNMFYWLIILVSLVPATSVLLPYGTLGVIIALCGYFCATRGAGYPMFLFASLSCYAFIELLYEGYARHHSFYLVLLFIALYRLLINFSIIPIKMPRSLNKPMLLLSRYSLMVYFIHYEIFYLIHYMMKIAK